MVGSFLLALHEFNAGRSQLHIGDRLIGIRYRYRSNSCIFVKSVAIRCMYIVAIQVCDVVVVVGGFWQVTQKTGLTNAIDNWSSVGWRRRRREIGVLQCRVQ